MTRTILTFGDSNTHGTPPMHSDSFHPRLERRWPVVMAEHIDCILVEDGLPGRTMCPIISTSPDVHLDGHLGLRMALNMHGPIDDLVIMLGSNDLKTDYAKTPAQIAGGLAGLLAYAKAPDMQERHGGFSISVMNPPLLKEVGTFVPEMWGGEEKSYDLAPLFKEQTEAWGGRFFDASEHIDVSPVDGVHFDAVAHETLGKAVAEFLS